MQTAAQEERPLTVNDVAKILCVTKRTIWRYVDQGKLPKPVHINCRVVRWRASDIRNIIAELKTTSR